MNLERKKKGSYKKPQISIIQLDLERDVLQMVVTSPGSADSGTDYGGDLGSPMNAPKGIFDDDNEAFFE